MDRSYQVEKLACCQIPEELKNYPSPVIKRTMKFDETLQNVTEKLKINKNKKLTAVITDDSVHFPYL